MSLLAPAQPAGAQGDVGLQLQTPANIAQGEPAVVTVEAPVDAGKFTLELAGPRDKRVPFGRFEADKPVGSFQIVPAQFFAEPGSFEVLLRPDGGGEPVARVGFEVGEPTVTVPRFEDVAAERGLRPRTVDFTCNDHSQGGAWGDVDADGDLDLYLPRRNGPSELWVNQDGRFSETAARSGVTNDDGLGTAAVFADYDNDGDADLYVVNVGANRLYRNNGAGRFTDVTRSARVGDRGIGSSAAWGDYDNDGYLDLYVTNYGRCRGGPGDDMGTEDDVLYRNEGDGTFTDQTALLGEGTTKGHGFQAGWVDIDTDGDQDLYLANDDRNTKGFGNVLWRNDGPGDDGKWSFTNVSDASGAGLAVFAMGLGVGDYDRDLDLDFAVSNIGPTLLLRNEGDGKFTDQAAPAAVGRPYQGPDIPAITWGAVFADLNNDGWEDLYIPAGNMLQKSIPGPGGMPVYPQPNALFVNEGGGEFADLSAPSGTDDTEDSRAAAVADYDRDGRLDMFVTNLGAPSRLLRNVTEDSGSWLEVRTVGTQSNRDGCGALIFAEAGGAKMLRQVFCGSVGLGSSNDPAVHFGLGDAETVSRLEIRWPSGERQVLTNVKPGQLLTVTEPAGSGSPLGWIVAAAGAALLLLLIVWVLRRRRRGAPSNGAESVEQSGSAAQAGSPMLAVAVLGLAVAIQAFHMVEHVAQVVQAKVIHHSHTHGLLGHRFDIEWVHVAYNWSLFAALAVVLLLAGREGRATWCGRHRLCYYSLVGVVFFQGYHAVEHGAKLWQHINGAAPAPGILGNFVDLVWLHFGINTVVIAMMGAGLFGLGLHRELASGRRATLARA